jgi:hypothetical protein
MHLMSGGDEAGQKPLQIQFCSADSGKLTADESKFHGGRTGS